MTNGRNVLTALCLILFTVMHFGCTQSSELSDSSKVQKIRIITLGFLQGRAVPFQREYSRGRTRKFGGAANVASVVQDLVEEAKAKGSVPIVVDLGDNLSGTAEALLTKGDIMARILRKLPLSAALVGNLEFAHGQEALSKYFKEYNIPFVASNISGPGGASLPFCQDFIEVMAGDEKILIAGLCPPNLKYICLPSNTKDVEVMEWFDAPLKKINEEKSKRNASILLLLSQESLGKKDEKLRKALDNNRVDLFVGLDFNRKGIVRQSENGYTITFPGHNRGQRVGVTDLAYSKSKGIFDITTRFKTVDDQFVQPDGSLEQWVQETTSKYTDMLAQKISKTKTPLDRLFFEEGQTGNLVADAIKEKTGAEIVCINSGGVSCGLPEGDIVLRDLYTLIPYQNKAVSFRISGKNLLEFLRKTLGKGSPLQVSGLKIELRSIEGKRGYEIISVTVNDKPIDEKNVYSFGTNDFVKDRSPQLIPEGKIEVYGLVRDVVAEYLKAHTPYTAPPKGRLKLHR